jgi:hypothetical protein
VALTLDAPDGGPLARLVVVTPDDGRPPADADAVTVGVGPLPGELAEACDVVLVEDGADVHDLSRVLVPSVDAALDELRRTLSHCPRAALSLTALLRLTARLPVSGGLVAESMAYSMLLAGPEFARWRSGRPARPVLDSQLPAVQLHRQGDDLVVTLDRPDRRNAFSAAMRDGLCDALDLVELDRTIRRAVIRGAGPDFCSGGDLDEFGSTPDVATAHLIRLDRSVAARVHRNRSRVAFELHGSCIGAGVELPSFAGHVLAAPGTVIRLPELAMGLVPGAGGTVGITSRIGRWRTAYLALTGTPLTATDALAWGLVDDVSAVP